MGVKTKIFYKITIKIVNKYAYLGQKCDGHMLVYLKYFYSLDFITTKLIFALHFEKVQ